MSSDLPILWQDEDLVIVNKPSGLLVHRSDLDRTANEFALQKVRDQVGAKVYPVHRLDRPTSGALLFARSPESARRLAAQFLEQKVEKSYLAIVRGWLEPRQQLIDYPLREELDRISDHRADQNKPAQSAQTQVIEVERCELCVQVDRFPTTRYALIRAQPKTGRKHQVRRHLRHIGHPLIGDVNHGVGKHNRFFNEKFGTRRLFLACESLTFEHPRTGVRMSVTAPLADDFASVVKALGWKCPNE